MKTIFVLLMLCGSLTVAAQQTKLHGSVKDLKNGRVELKSTNAASEIWSNRGIVVTTDADGNFSTTVDLDAPGYYTINHSIVYLSPGDDLEIRVAQTAEATTFEGKGSSANNYLKGNGAWVESINKIDSLPLQQLVMEVMAVANIRRLELEGLTDVSDQFRVNEQGRITVALIDFLLARKIIPEGDIDRMISMLGDQNPAFNKKDDLLDVAPVRKFFLKNFKEEDSSPRLNELVDVIRVSKEIDAGNSSEKSRYFEEYTNKINDKSFRAAFEAKLAAASRFMVGAPAIDLELRDAEGKISKLSDHRGQILYIDFWASWCLPCLLQSPRYKELSLEYPDVKFLSISIDQDETKWKALMEVNAKVEGRIEEYICGPVAAAESWGVKSIPHFVLIDKDFRIVNYTAPRPSEREAIKEALDSLLTSGKSRKKK